MYVGWWNADVMQGYGCIDIPPVTYKGFIKDGQPDGPGLLCELNDQGQDVSYLADWHTTETRGICFSNVPAPSVGLAGDEQNEKDRFMYYCGKHTMYALADLPLELEHLLVQYYFHPEAERWQKGCEAFHQGSSQRSPVLLSLARPAFLAEHAKARLPSPMSFPGPWITIDRD